MMLHTEQIKLTGILYTIRKRGLKFPIMFVIIPSKKKNPKPCKSSVKIFAMKSVWCEIHSPLD